MILRFAALANVLLILFCTNVTHSVEMIITQSGMYKLGGDLTIAPAAADTIISIQASDVTLDLGGYIISQANATGNVDGIQILSGLRNITIMNGTVRGLSRFGISCASSCSNINISNLDIENCGLRGLSIVGITDFFCNNISVKECMFSGCCQTSITGTIVHFEWANNVKFSDCLIQNVNNVQPNALITVVTCTIVQGISVNNLAINDVTTPALTIFDLSGVQSSSFSDIAIERNSSSIGFIVGFLLRNAGVNLGLTGNLFNRIILTRNIAQTTFTGYDVDGFINTFINCSIVLNTANGASFIGINMPTTNAILNTFNQCQILYNSSSGTSQGFLIQSSGNRSAIIDNYIGVNSAGSGISVGIDITVANANCAIIQNNLAGNVGSTSSFGIRVPASPNNLNNLFTKNLAYINGTTSGNQLNNIPAVTTLTAPATSNMNATSNPAWTNIPLAA